MDPVAVLHALEALGYTPDALESVGPRIIVAEVVSVDNLVAAGLSGRDIIAVRRALDPSVSKGCDEHEGVVQARTMHAVACVL